MIKFFDHVRDNQLLPMHIATLVEKRCYIDIHARAYWTAVLQALTNVGT